MKVVILAAGKGSRLMPLTQDIPKALVEINDKPFLEYVLDHLHQAECTDLALVVGYQKEKIAKFLHEQNITATIIEQTEQLGTGHAILQAEQFADGDDFLVYYADNLLSPMDIKRFTELDGQFHYTGGVTVAHPENYGVIVEDAGMVREVREKPKEFFGNLANPGFYRFKPEIFSLLKQVNHSPRGEIEINDAVNVLAKQGKVKVIKLQDYWLDLGTPEDIPKIEKFLTH
jgi:UDP-N-acetylglucosamine diphosphorylase / glucose-1-phosphate thymidylyltransferase / UDP-N-acetylgalactosamine diphosphorylase / glucosamine-1-phosphate N-acetyltransferase / galactosamine-1-phosphate N-acetyltransferase